MMGPHMRKITIIEKTLVFVLVAIILVSVNLSCVNTYAKLKNPQYEGVVYSIIAKTLSTPSGKHNIRFNSIICAKPHLYNRNGLFNIAFNIKPYWDRYALAAAYIPASLEIYRDTNPQYPREAIISKRPTNIGLIAVFRGSIHHGTLPRGGTYTLQYRLYNGTMHLHVATKSYRYTYVVKVFLKKYDKVKAEFEAWIKARVGLSAKLKLFNFVNAGLKLVDVEAGVRAKVTKTVAEEKGYEYIVEITIPTYKFKITYTASVHVVEEYNAKGNGDLPTSADSSTNVVSRAYSLDLKANGMQICYTDYEELTTFTCDDQFNAGGTTGTVVFDRA